MLRPEGRTPVEVTAAAERTADLALRCVKLVSEREQARRERDEALAAIERVRALVVEYDKPGGPWLLSQDLIVNDLRAALGERP